jgi:hypothetical protein
MDLPVMVAAHPEVLGIWSMTILELDTLNFENYSYLLGAKLPWNPRAAGSLRFLSHDMYSPRLVRRSSEVHRYKFLHQTGPRQLFANLDFASRWLCFDNPGGSILQLGNQPTSMNAKGPSAEYWVLGEIGSIYIDSHRGM